MRTQNIIAATREDNRARLYEDEAMRLVVAFTGLAVVVSVAAPAQAEPDPDANFLACVP